MIFDKVTWMARATTTVVGLAIMLALVLGVATTAFGANGNNFILGSINNAATAITKLTGNVNGPAMQVVNNNADANDTALDLRVQSGEAPMRVNSRTRVANLNAASAGRADSAAQADSATNANTLDNKDSSEFVQNTGEMTFSVFDSWMSSHSPSNPITVDHRGNFTTFTKGATGSTQSEVRLAPPLPSSLYGKSMLLTGMEICYITSDPAVALTRVKLLRYSSENATVSGGNFVVEDNTPTDGNQCRMYRGTPQLMGTNSFALLEMHVNWSETTSPVSFGIARTTFFLEPSNTPAAPL